MQVPIAQTNMHVVCDTGRSRYTFFRYPRFRITQFVCEVLKRQNIGCNVRILSAPLSRTAANPYAGCTVCVPVSYTHLDVYKRQEYW